MEFGELLYGVRDRVATVTLNRPDRMNAWTPTMEIEFRTAVRAASDDDAVRAIVVTGAGRGFCAGADMGRLSAAVSGQPGPAATAPPPSGDGDFEQRYSWLLAVPKPLVAGINGAVAGVGWDPLESTCRHASLSIL